MSKAINDAFLRAYVDCFTPLENVRKQGQPDDLIVRVSESKGWIVWEPKPCDAPLHALFERAEAFAGRIFPPSFRTWYGSYFTLEMDVSVARLPANPPFALGEPLLHELQNPFGEAALRSGLLPFGQEAEYDAGPLCFDPRDGGNPDEWPIRFWDHDSSDPDNAISAVIFSNFNRLLQGCTAYMLAFADVKKRMADPDQWLDHRPDCIEALVAADPEGAGITGRDYWLSDD